MSVTYYNLHRLKSYSGLTNNYGYDATGNITTNSEGGGSKYAYASPRIQAVLTAFGYTNLYDLCGNMMVRHGGLTNSQALVYDAENRLSAVAQAGVMSDEFGYAYDDTRLWKRIDQNSTNIQVWIGNIYEQKGGKILFHVYAGSEQVCTFEATSSLDGGSNTNAVGYYYHQDNLNTSSALSGSGGSQAELNVYYPFGRIQTAAPQASFQVSRRFTGQVFDAESGLYYYNARYYDPELGRFTQPDTVIQDLANPQSYNRYSYCGNNPLRYTDPSGKDFVKNAGLINGPYAYMVAKSTLGQIGASFYNAIPLIDNSIYQVLRPVNAAYDVAGDVTHDAVLITTGDPQLADNSRNLPLLFGGEIGLFGKLEKTDNALVAVEKVTAAPTTGPKLMYHYTRADESSFANGLREGSSATDKLYTNPYQAGQELGIPVPNKVIPIKDTGQFVPAKPPIVQGSNRYKGGGNDFNNTDRVPPSQLLPAQPMNPK
jgi:RHS repeat-associated protein